MHGKNGYYGGQIDNVPRLVVNYNMVTAVPTWRENICHQDEIANTTVPIWSWFIFSSQPPGMQKPSMERSLYIYIYIYIYILFFFLSITDHDHLKTNMVRRFWLSLHLIRRCSASSDFQEALIEPTASISRRDPFQSALFLYVCMFKYIYIYIYN